MRATASYHPYDEGGWGRRVVMATTLNGLMVCLMLHLESSSLRFETNPPRGPHVQRQRAARRGRTTTCTWAEAELLLYHVPTLHSPSRCVCVHTCRVPAARHALRRALRALESAQRLLSICSESVCVERSIEKQRQRVSDVDGRMPQLRSQGSAFAQS